MDGEKVMERGEKVKIKKYEQTDVATALLKWFKQCRSSGTPVNSGIMKSKAEDFF